MPWLVRSVRFTSFLMPGVTLPPEMWRVVLGGEPDNSTQQRAASLRQETGAFGDSIANLTVQPGRVDLLFLPVETPEPNLATFGEYPGAAEPYRTTIASWVSSEAFPAARRFALGIVLIEPTESRETGYEQLRHFIDVVPMGEASDFLYQVNRHRSSTAAVPDLRVNRLAKWSVSELRLLTMNAGGPAATTPFTFLNLDLDVNTSVEFAGPIPAGVGRAVLDDLWVGADEIATQGDHVG